MFVFFAYILGQRKCVFFAYIMGRREYYFRVFGLIFKL